MTFTSLLFAGTERPDESLAEAPQHFRDLALDRVTAGATEGRSAYELLALWYLPLTDSGLIAYRQGVFVDLAVPAVRNALETFAGAMGDIDRQLAADRRAVTAWQARRWVLNAANRYCDTISTLADALPTANPRSPALMELSTWLINYVAGESFTVLQQESERVLAGLGAIRYNVLLRGRKVTVEAFDEEADLTELVKATFARFRQRPTREYHCRLPNPYFDAVTATISDLVAPLFPAEHNDLARFATTHARFVDPTIGLLARELQFYLGYLEYLTQLQAAGLPITLPRITDQSALHATDTYDIALAASLVAERSTVVTNDVSLTDGERTLVISGPNQGGKTTLARTIGQLHYLASLGCPVPGHHVSLAVPDGIYTHFERQEDLTTHAGKLEDDLIRIHAILDAATEHSVVILNEVFSSTTLEDARTLSIDVLTRLASVEALCVCVTFIDELSRLNAKTVSVVATVDDKDPSVRTLRLQRRPADGRAYALALARKYGLAYEQLTQRNIGRPAGATGDREGAAQDSRSRASTSPPVAP